eukprot:GHVP01023165.1.p1 GENE.GHVP01023165.1~~GHVP01023165.1.p1  ORF type:complete len:121 (-),score=21.95 GHVP01023165.1:865-1227(-)
MALHPVQNKKKIFCAMFYTKWKSQETSDLSKKHFIPGNFKDSEHSVRATASHDIRKEVNCRESHKILRYNASDCLQESKQEFPLSFLQEKNSQEVENSFGESNQQSEFLRSNHKFLRLNN